MAPGDLDLTGLSEDALFEVSAGACDRMAERASM
jgi:hypothetical protein